MTTVEVSVEVEASPERVWAVASNPKNLAQWDRHVIRIRLPEEEFAPGFRYEVTMGFMGVRTVVKAEMLEWEPPWRSRLRLEGLLEATVTTSVASLPNDRSVLRQQVDFRFKGPLGRFGASSLNAMGGAQIALRRGVMAQKRQIEARS
ncbi:MAG: SRPBCC family protein [Vicinamibacteria bacterium]